MAARVLIVMVVAVPIGLGAYVVARWKGRSPVLYAAGTFVLALIHPVLGVVALLWDLVRPAMKVAE